MIVVDTSVWIDHLRDEADLPHVRRFRAALGQEPVVVGDLTMLEILLGMADKRRAAKVERLLREFVLFPC